MARTSIFHHRRGQDTLFAQRTWYMIQPLDRPGIGLYAGMGRDNPIVHMAPNAYSSQNWQLFPQAGRYFIRNWDWHSPFQLGISADRNQSVLAMLPRSGSLSQQWIVNKVDGGYELLNGLLGNATKLLAESDFVAVMKSGESGIWNITRNERYVDPTRLHECVSCLQSRQLLILIIYSAEQAGPKEKEMYDEVAEFQVMLYYTVAFHDIPSQLGVRLSNLPLLTIHRLHNLPFHRQPPIDPCRRLHPHPFNPLSLQHFLLDPLLPISQKAE